MSNKTFKIIVVDDDPAFGKLIQNCISEVEDCEILLFQNSDDFFSAFSNNKVQLAIIDDNLNEANVDGLYILKDIIKRGHEVKVIALSGEHTIQKVVDYMDGGAWKYISKDDQDWPKRIEMHVREAIMEQKRSRMMDNVSYEDAVDMIMKKDELLNSFFNDFPALFAIINKQGKFMMVNDKWQEFGWNRHDLKFLQIQDIVCSECAEKFDKHLLTAEQKKVDFVCIVKAKNGERININWQIIQNKDRYFCIGKPI